MGVTDPRKRLLTLLTTDPDEHIDQRTDRRPSENTVVESLTRTINGDETLWAESELSLWELMVDVVGQAMPPQDALREFGHPLQPDIDVLLGSLSDGEKQPPLVGVEAKYFGEYRGLAGHKLLPKRLGPEGNPMGGFYSGLGQALSLLSMGLDYVYLWHVFEINEAIYQPNRNSGDQTKDHRDVLRVYARQMKDMINTFGLPVGYIATGMSVNHDNKMINLAHCSPADERTSQTRSAANVRELLIEALSSRERTTSKLTGSGDEISLEAEILSVDHIWKDTANRPDIKGRLRVSNSGVEVPFIVDSGVSHPYFEVGDSFRFTKASDHYYAPQDEVQLRITDQTTISTI